MSVSAAVRNERRGSSMRCCGGSSGGVDGRVTFNVLTYFSTRTAHCLKLGSREMGSKAPSVTQVGVGLREMEGHENLPGRDDAGDAQFQILHAAAAGDDSDAIVRA